MPITFQGARDPRRTRDGASLLGELLMALDPQETFRQLVDERNSLLKQLAALEKQRDEAMAALRASKEPNDYFDKGLLAIGQSLIAKDVRIASLEKLLDEAPRPD